MAHRIGHDLVDIERFRRIASKHPERWQRRVFTRGEWEHTHTRRDPYPSLAARFAAKEAAMKVLGTGWGQGVRWLDVEVTGGGRSAPTLKLHGRAHAIARSLNLELSVSLTHTSKLASAMVLGIGTSARPSDQD